MPSDWSSLVGSRICHDLISPIGAIGNGIELMTLTGGDGAAEVELISESVQNASARIRFFRVAYGAASSEQSIGRSEILAILSASARGGRMTYYWQIDGDQPRQEVRVTFLLLQCFETAMPMGGDVQIAQDADGWVLTGTSDKLAFDDGLWGPLTNGIDPISLTAAQVQFALLPQALAEAQRRLSVERSDNRITVRF